MKTLFKILQGALIGLGAILPGISGGVLCVIFGIYKPVMELLSHPFKNFKTHVPKLIPVIIGVGIGFLGIAKVLSFVLDKYPGPSVCLFIGLVIGMLPALWREAGEQGRSAHSYTSLAIAMIIMFALLISLKIFKIEIVPNLGWYLFCGFCLALSVIAPGMSFSTLMLPLGLFQPFTSAVETLNFSVLVPAGIGAVVTVLLFAKLVNSLFESHYSVSFHAIVGIVIAATAMIIPLEDDVLASFMISITQTVINIVSLVVGIIAALLLDKFNSSVSKE